MIARWRDPAASRRAISHDAWHDRLAIPKRGSEIAV